MTEELKPAVAYLAGAEAFEVFRNSGTPDSINKKIRKCRIMEFDDAKGGIPRESALRPTIEA